MSITKIVTNNRTQKIDLVQVSKLSSQEQLIIYNNVDILLVDLNKKKYINTKQTINLIQRTKIPTLLNHKNLTLMALLNFFLKRFVAKKFSINLDLDTIYIVSKPQNFPHLIGIKSLRDKDGNIINKTKPREFLDGVLYQWVLMNNYTGFDIDFEKLEVFSWMTQTLSNPTYILNKNAIKKKATKFNADLVFIRKVFHSDKYAFHIVGLKRENNNNFAFISQFAIKKRSYLRLYSMFNIKKAFFDFYKNSVPR